MTSDGVHEYMRGLREEESEREVEQERLLASRQERKKPGRPPRKKREKVEPHIIKPYQVLRLTNQEEPFYSLIGPFLSRREIVGELGSPVWDDDGKVWFVAVSEDGVIGCVGVQQKRAHSLISSLYVIPEGRKQVVGATLLARALGETKGEVRAVVTEMSRELFTLAGFEETGARGGFTLMKRDSDVAR